MSYTITPFLGAEPRALYLGTSPSSSNAFVNSDITCFVENLGYGLMSARGSTEKDFGLYPPGINFLGVAKKGLEAPESICACVGFVTVSSSFPSLRFPYTLP